MGSQVNKFKPTRGNQRSGWRVASQVNKFKHAWGGGMWIEGSQMNRFETLPSRNFVGGVAKYLENYYTTEWFLESSNGNTSAHLTRNFLYSLPCQDVKSVLVVFNRIRMAETLPSRVLFKLVIMISMPYITTNTAYSTSINASLNRSLGYHLEIQPIKVRSIH